MAYTGNIIYLNGSIALPMYGMRVEEIEENYGSFRGLVTIPKTDLVVNTEHLAVHVYRDGLLLHVMRPNGTWYPPIDEYDERHYGKRLLLKLEEHS